MSTITADAAFAASRKHLLATATATLNQHLDNDYPSEQTGAIVQGYLGTMRDALEDLMQGSDKAKAKEIEELKKRKKLWRKLQRTCRALERTEEARTSHKAFFTSLTRTLLSLNQDNETEASFEERFPLIFQLKSAGDILVGLERTVEKLNRRMFSFTERIADADVAKEAAHMNYRQLGDAVLELQPPANAAFEKVKTLLNL